MSMLVLFHISTAVVGLLSGALSMVVRKGSGPHRVAGNIFFASMMSMSSAGAYLAAFVKPNLGNVMGGVLTFYLVGTAWVAAKRRERRTGIVDWAALLIVLTLGATDTTLGVEAARSATGLKNGYPAGLYFTFGTIALLFAASDIRMLLRGGIAGAQRIARHLWRMCLAFLMALVSFYPARAHLFSRAVNESRLLYVPHVLLIGAMVFWMVRIHGRKRHQKADNMQFIFNLTPRSDSPSGAQ